MESEESKLPQRNVLVPSSHQALAKLIPDVGQPLQSQRSQEISFRPGLALRVVSCAKDISLAYSIAMFAMFLSVMVAGTHK